MAKFTFEIDHSASLLYIKHNNNFVTFDMKHVDMYMIDFLVERHLDKFMNAYKNNMYHHIQVLKKHIENREKFLKLVEEEEN